MYDVGCGDGRVLIQMACQSIQLDLTATPHRPSRDDTNSNGQCNGTNHHHNQQQHHYCHQFVGIEISSSRADEARSNIHQARIDGLIPSHVTIDIRCSNALEVDYSRATVVFLYLVPRGLRLIQPILRDGKKESMEDPYDLDGGGETINNTVDSQLTQQRHKPRRIISYMNPMEGWTVVRKEYCKVGNVEGAAFPIFLYHL